MATRTSKVPRIDIKQAAEALGVSEAFLLSLALSGAKQPPDRGEGVVEIEYEMRGNELVFTEAGIERFRARCPVGDMLTSAAVEKRLGIRRADISTIAYAGIQTADGRVARLPFWEIGNVVFVAVADLDEFEQHYRAWAERKERRAWAKRRGGRPAAQTNEA